jgi:putative flippase GtrA
VQLSPSALLERARSPEGQKALKYTAVSVISVLVAYSTLFVVYVVLHVWAARGSSIFATCVGAVPSYYLNRRWAWGKTGRSHFRKEIVPFWVIAMIGLAFSTWATDFTESHVASITSAHLLQKLLVTGSYLGAFGVLWVAKFIVFNKFIFVSDEDERAAWADEVVG